MSYNVTTIVEYRGKLHNYYNLTRDPADPYKGVTENNNIWFNICEEVAPPVSHCPNINNVAGWVFSDTECFPAGSLNSTLLNMSRGDLFQLTFGKVTHADASKSLLVVLLCPTMDLETTIIAKIYSIQQNRGNNPSDHFIEYQIMLYTTEACTQSDYDYYGRHNWSRIIHTIPLNKLNSHCPTING